MNESTMTSPAISKNGQVTGSKQRSANLKILVLGLGNTLLGDEAVGVETIRYLQSRHPGLDNTEMLDGGTLSFTLAGPIEDADALIVIDAAQLNSEPGTVRVYEGAEMDRFVMGSKKSSVHEISLADLLVIAQLSDHLPPYRALVGIQPQTIDWSDSLSESVQRAIPLACDQALRLMTRWRRSAD